MTDAVKKLLYADDLALVANDKQELQETLDEWNGLFTRLTFLYRTSSRILLSTSSIGFLSYC